MLNEFVQVPDWFSWENQGCGVAAASLGGARSLVFFAVDAGMTGNRGVYRIGGGVDPLTGVANTWGPWREVPDWLSQVNQGGDVAVGDITGDGTPDLLVLRVDAPAGQNAGFYRVGRGLTADGEITGGWAPWVAVPDWFSWENQGAGVALGDLNDSGKLDLVAFMIDNGAEQNRALYRIGHDLDANGVAADWTPWLDVDRNIDDPHDVGPWFSWDNQGGGVALADRRGDGSLDLVVFGIDSPPGPQGVPSENPSGQNQAYYLIGEGLAPDGTVSGGWSTLLGINNWFSWDNQYGALTVLGTGAAARLLVAAIDNPPELNAGFYTSIALTETPAVHGQWEVLPYLSGVLAIHAAMLHTGKVLFFSGTGNNTVRDAAPDFGDVTKGLWTSVVWDPTAPNGANFAHPATILRDNGRPFDFFCGGDTFLPDGRIFSAGGNLSYNNANNLGQRETASFDPQAEQWTRRATMDTGRWYPTVLTLGDGRLLAVSGKNQTDGNLNQRFDIYHGDTDTWQVPPLTPPQINFPGLPYYPHLFLMTDGRIFFSGGRMDMDSPLPAGILDLANPIAVGFAPVISQVAPDMRNQSSSVLLPPAQEQRVMIIGGGPRDDRTSATGSTERIDLLAGNPAFELTMPLSLPRMHLNAVLLPDRTVFVSGGAIEHELADVAHVPRLQSEIYDPAANTWRAAATATVVRMYHSVALLMPDATVMTASGNPPPGGNQVPWVEEPTEELKIEIFTPPYRFAGNAPQITTAPTEWTYNAKTVIQTRDAGAVMWAELIHPGVTTHAFDNAQRLIDLPINTVTATELTVGTPIGPDLAPPGWYMLFLVNQQRIPSTATWIHLS